MISSKLDEADASLTCQTTSTIVPAKAIVRITTAEVTLVDRRTHRPIWRTAKSEAFDTTRLADELIEQLKKDWRKSASEYWDMPIRPAATPWHQIKRRKLMKAYEVTLHGTDSIYVLALTKYRALELVGDYLADAGRADVLQSSKLVVRQIDLSEEQLLRSERCRACPLDE
jgi:hypothetical protein